MTAEGESQVILGGFEQISTDKLEEVIEAVKDLDLPVDFKLDGGSDGFTGGIVSTGPIENLEAARQAVTDVLVNILSPR